ncbi:hypothetical protein SBA2_90012 [Acidobacteriia bacterium SbA2]|nr:hypothetical protein SBA2_90012 [Acidobacteriia bacterium SbA2]
MECVAETGWGDGTIINPLQRLNMMLGKGRVVNK